MQKNITYSKSYTLTLTHSCANNCLYCGFRKDDEGIIPFSEVEEILKTAKEKGHWEILVMSGENPQKTSKVARELKSLGYTRFAGYAADICKLILKKFLLPHTNIGILSFEDLSILKKYNASMGLMLENINTSFGRTVHPQKDITERLRVIEDAGKLKIPFTTGILVGLGEKQKDRIDSLKEIIRLHIKYNHIQEIIIQNFIPNSQSKLKISDTVSFEDYKEIISFVRSNSDIPVQIPQNLNTNYIRILEFGASDLGGISEGGDHVNPERAWEKIEEISRKIEPFGYKLKGRLPVYKKYYQFGWYSDEVGRVIDGYLQNREFEYYKFPLTPLC